MDEDQELYRILSGIIRFKYKKRYYILRSPTPILKYKAKQLYNNIIDKANKSLYLDRTTLYDMIGHLDLSQQSKQLNKRIDDLKVDAYKACFKDHILREIKIQIEIVNKRLSDIQYRMNQYNYLTLEGMADVCMQEYIILHTVCREGSNVSKLIPKQINFNLLSTCIKVKNENILNQSQLRKLSQNSLWRSYWISNKNIFKTKPSSWTEEQLILVYYTKMYDGVYKSMDCPIEKVINDDDMLDGWYIYNNRKREKEYMNHTIEELLGKPDVKTPDNSSDRSSVFLPAASVKQAKEINELNTIQGKRIKQQTFDLIKEKGTVQELELYRNTKHVT